jgi:hypothetical protein
VYLYKAKFNIAQKFKERKDYKNNSKFSKNVKTCGYADPTNSE